MQLKKIMAVVSQKLSFYTAGWSLDVLIAWIVIIIASTILLVWGLRALLSLFKRKKPDVLEFNSGRNNAVIRMPAAVPFSEGRATNVGTGRDLSTVVDNSSVGTGRDLSISIDKHADRSRPVPTNIDLNADRSRPVPTNIDLNADRSRPVPTNIDSSVGRLQPVPTNNEPKNNEVKNNETTSYPLQRRGENKVAAKKDDEIVSSLQAIAGENIITTQLDLAHAYLAMEQYDMAKTLLRSVIQSGDQEQKTRAELLLTNLSSG